MNYFLVFYLIIFLAVFFICVMIADNIRFVIRKYPVYSSKVKEKSIFVFVTDLHGKDYGDQNKKLLDAIRKIRPDAVLCGGDMIISKPVSYGRTESVDVAVSFLKELAAEFPVFLADGNHESKLNAMEEYRPIHDRYIRELAGYGVRFLDNCCVMFNGIRIYGLNLDQISYQKIVPYYLPKEAVNEKLGASQSDVFSLVLAHNPKFFENYAEWGADLTLSGHVHGGLMRIGKFGFIAPDLHLFPKYSFGEYVINKSEEKRAERRMIVSCGIGAHTLPIRIFNPGEISVVEIYPETK